MLEFRRIIVGLQNGVIKIYDENLSTTPNIVNLNPDLAGFGVQAATKPGTPYLSVSTNINANMLAIVRLE
jgi:hypothetical protein